MKKMKASRAIKIGSVSLVTAMLLSPVSAFASEGRTFSQSMNSMSSMSGGTVSDSTYGNMPMTGSTMMDDMDMMGGSMSGGSTMSGGSSMMDDMDMMGDNSMSGGSTMSGGSSMMDDMDMMSDNSMSGGSTMSGGSSMMDDMDMMGDDSMSGSTPMSGGSMMDDMDMMGDDSMSGSTPMSGGSMMDDMDGMEDMDMMEGMVVIPSFDVKGMVHGVSADEQVKLTLMNGMNVVKETALADNGMDYDLSGIPAGDYMLYVDINNVTAALKHVKVTNDNVTVDDVDLHTISGTITGVEPGTAANILLAPFDVQMGIDMVKPLVITASDNTISFSAKAAVGSYSLKVTAPGYENYESSQITLGHQDSTLDPIELIKN